MKWILILGVVMIAGLFFWFNVNKNVVKEHRSENYSKIKKGKDDKEKKNKQITDVQIISKWDLPSELKEVSGIAYINDKQFACVQDEQGIIFIYNTSSGEIEKKINFHGPGDYEGIALNGNTAYVLRADGNIFEVNLNADKTTTKEHKTALTVKHNVEGLCLDKKNNRLLLAIKNDEPGGQDYKGIYGFDLASKTMASDPVIKIDLAHEMLGDKKGKKKSTVRPSALNIHPLTNEIYIVDGPGSKLMIMDEAGNIKKYFTLGKDFAQPEGISFSPAGEIFISNEGTKEPGNILQIQLNQQ